MTWNRALAELRDELASLYPSAESAQRVAQDAGVPLESVPTASTARDRWHGILLEADKRARVAAIVDVASQEYPDREVLRRAAAGDAVVRAPLADRSGNDSPPDPGSLEKLMGAESTLLPVSFLQLGMDRARQVARVVLPDGSFGTGFLTTGNLLITNYHVLSEPGSAHNAFVEFNFQRTADGLDAPTETRRLDPDSGFAASEKDDWTAVVVADNANQQWGALELRKRNPRVNDRVNIIQHAGGGPKQIALYHNLVTAVGADRVQYLTDTLPGSSGSPVFDQDWCVVALHHSGGNLPDLTTKRVFWRNEGVHINVVIDGVRASTVAERLVVRP